VNSECIPSIGVEKKLYYRWFSSLEGFCDLNLKIQIKIPKILYFIFEKSLYYNYEFLVQSNGYVFIQNDAREKEGEISWKEEKNG
jgi:hypothetical protein